MTKKKKKKKDGQSTSSQISTTSIEHIIAQLRTMKYRDSTKTNYYTVWKLFNKFFVQLNRKPSTWEQRIELFTGYLINNNKQSATVKSYLSAIRAVLQDNNITLNEDLTLINSLTKACRLVNDQIKTRFSINKDMLSVLVRQIENDYLNRNQPYLSTLYKTLLITTYFGLFRVGELTDTPGKHAARAKDVHIAHNKKKFSFVLRTSKTHWKNSKPQIIKISTSHGKKELTNRIIESTLPCPYQTIKHYLQL